MAGDVVWHPSQRTVDGVLLGHRVRIPEAPYMMSYVSGAPLILFFAFRTGSRRYHFTAGEPILVKAACRSDREKSVRATAQQYLDALEHAVRQHPMEWYHFEAFLGPPIRRPNGEFLPSPADGA
jgi:predicted LPLAT superfamily acyltransferase